MKIIIDARLYGLEHAGIGRYVMNLVDELSKIDRKNTYTIFLKSKYFKTLDLSSNWEKVQVDVPHYSVAEQLFLPFILRRYKSDLVHFPHFNVPIAFSSPLVVTIHDLIKHTSRGPSTTTRVPSVYWVKYLTYRLVFSNAVSKASKIVVPSQWVKNELIETYQIQPDKIVVTYEGVDKVFQSPVTSLPAGKAGYQSPVLEKYKIKKPYVIYAGSAYPHKNIETLIKAIGSVNSSPMLVIASARNVFFKRLESFIEKSESKNVRLLGFVPDKDLAILYKEADAFVFPTLSEGFGLPGLEAMAAGTAVVCSDIAVLREVYGDAALYFNPLDATDIADKIAQILANDQLRTELVEEGRQQVKKYSWRKMAEETLRAYEQTAG